MAAARADSGGSRTYAANKDTHVAAHQRVGAEPGAAGDGGPRPHEQAARAGGRGPEGAEEGDKEASPSGLREAEGVVHELHQEGCGEFEFVARGDHDGLDSAGRYHFNGGAGRRQNAIRDRFCGHCREGQEAICADP